MLPRSLLCVLWACSCLGIPMRPQVEPKQVAMQQEMPKVPLLSEANRDQPDQKAINVEQEEKPIVEVNKMPMVQIRAKDVNSEKMPAVMPKTAVNDERKIMPILQEGQKTRKDRMPRMPDVKNFEQDAIMPGLARKQQLEPSDLITFKEWQNRRAIEFQAEQNQMPIMPEKVEMEQNQMPNIPKGVLMEQHQGPQGVEMGKNHLPIMMMPKQVQTEQNRIPKGVQIDPKQPLLMSEDKTAQILPQQDQTVPDKVRAEPDRLVIIMLDGFRWDYEDRFQELPAFAEFRAEGVRAKYVQPIFPSVSFPSWTTIATGLYPESHGVVGNYMYDPDSKMVFSLDWVGQFPDTTNDTRWWRQHTPIWASATSEGIPTSMYLWSRCDVPFSVNGKQTLPEKCVPYNNDDCLSLQKFSKNLYDGVQDLKSGTELLMIYYGNVDELGHIYGPDSGQVIDEIIQVNWALESFLNQLAEARLLERTNIVLVSDHGMTSIRDKNFRKITDFTDAVNLERVVERNAYAMVQVADGADADVVAREIAAWKDVDVYTKSQIPEQFHLRNNDLVLDLLLVPKADTLIMQDARFPDMHIPTATQNQNQHPGAHGFDGTGVIGNDPFEYVEGPNPNMRGIFYAMGPAFKKGLLHDWIKLVDEYQVFTYVLGIEGEKHNGTWNRVRDMFEA